MPANAVAENVFGTMGAIFWTVQLIPRLFKTWRTKSTEGFSPWLVFFWGISALPLGVYVIAQDLNVPLIVQPQLFGLFALLSWCQCLYYGTARLRTWCIVVLCGTLVLWGGLEAALVSLSPAYRRGTPAGKTGVRFFGILGSTLISVALIGEKHRAVLGISLTFMAIDLLGGLFSILSLAFKHKVDVLAARRAVAYSIVVITDGLVLVLAMILNPRLKGGTERKEERSGDRARDSDGGALTSVVPAIS
ncbi:hypothetical protein BC826DRAFT_961216 [Russula brevipes]|nr:hypothetical protein BC826DRAFT_961216 [Russula brevipes]